MSFSPDIDQALLRQWHMEKLDPSALEDVLRNRGLDTQVIGNYVQAYRKFCTAKKQFVGFVLMSLGAFLGFVSCVLSLVNPWPSLYNLILFGLTSLAILIIVAGMYCLFE